MKRLLKCAECGNYALRPDCSCGGTAVALGPAKFSPEDAYGRYRRQAKKFILKERGFL